MASVPEQELISSVKRLYNDPEFSDIKVIGSEKEYNLHKAIICPRSTYFAAECRALQEKGEDGPLDVKADDPTAVDRVVEYLYTLDYSDDTNGSATPKVNGIHEPVANGSLVNGDAETTEAHRPPTPDAVHEAQQSPREDLADNSLDDFIPPSKQNKPKRKNKKRRQSMAPPTDKPNEPEAEADHETPAPEAPAPAAEEPTVVVPVVVPEPPRQTILETHAKVYALSSKYGIPDLQSSALEKFEDRARSFWDADDFLAAAKEVYANTPSKPTVNGDAVDDTEKKTMRDAITTIMHQHAELMDKMDMVKEVGLDLALDLLHHIRESGGWPAKE